jgi:hypothetical protein
METIELGSTNKAALPAISAMGEISLVTTGTPYLKASIMGNPKPS